MAKKKRQTDLSLRADDDSSDSNGENETKTSVVNCPHANKAIHLPGVKKALKTDGSTLMCVGCSKGKSNGNITSERKSENINDNDNDNDNGNENENENEALAFLICLKCGHCGCGNGNKHAEQHSNNRKSEVHDLVLNLTSWTVWCFKCNMEIPSNSSKKLLECYEFVKKFIASGSVELITNSFENDTVTKPSVNFMSKSHKNLNSSKYPPSFESYTIQNCNSLDFLPKARGLRNLGNTCFFNAVLQCLGQTPFLLSVLEEMKQEGEKFRLPAAEVLVGDEKEVLEPLEGTLKGWGQVTQILADTLSEINSGKTEVYYPQKLLNQIHLKSPQFAGYDQHDSHELLRQLLDIVRTEDLQRYKQAILESLNLDKKSERDNITEKMRRKVKAYGKLANDLILRPEQVFRGFLVSTLECQECHHKSDHIESFLDLSLPVMADKPIHVRLKSTHDERGDLNSSPPSKHQLKKMRKAASKVRKNRHKHQSFNAGGDATHKKENVRNSIYSDNQDQSDADVEDNVEPESLQIQDVIESGYSSEKQLNGDSTCGSPASETNVNINRDSAIASPIINENATISGTADQVLNLKIPDNNSLLKDNCVISSLESQQSMTCHPSPHSSSSEAKEECHLSLSNGEGTIDNPHSRFANEAETDVRTVTISANNVNDSQVEDLLKNSFYADVERSKFKSDSEKMARLENGFGKMHLETLEKEKTVLGLCNRDDDDEDEDDEDFIENMGGTIGQRSHCQNQGECTIQSCLNQFTAKELMTGNNKVGCEACTNRMNRGKAGKTVLTNTSKQLLIGGPPAVLILHLKRFQVFRRTFKKKCREVKFPMILDLAPYCLIKCKGESTIKKNQNEILYSLYGVVEHMGTFHRGHYVAYIKVRSPLKADDPRWSFLPKTACSNLDSEDKVKNFKNDESAQTGAVGGTLVPPPGKWYYVSDSCTSEVKEENVLSSKAYLLFYERIW